MFWSLINSVLQLELLEIVVREPHWSPSKSAARLHTLMGETGWRDLLLELVRTLESNL